MNNPEEIVRIVDEACLRGASFVGIASDLQQAAPKHDADLAQVLKAVAVAFSYDFAERHSDRRDDFGPFVPLFDMGRLDEVSGEMLGLWAGVCAQASAAAAQARLGDLLWTRRVGDSPHSYARGAIKGYRALAETWRDLDASEALVRSLELALELGDRDEAEVAAEHIVKAVSCPWA